MSTSLSIVARASAVVPPRPSASRKNVGGPALPLLALLPGIGGVGGTGGTSGTGGTGADATGSPPSLATVAPFAESPSRSQAELNSGRASLAWSMMRLTSLRSRASTAAVTLRVCWAFAWSMPQSFRFPRTASVSPLEKQDGDQIHDDTGDNFSWIHCVSRACFAELNASTL